MKKLTGMLLSCLLIALPAKAAQVGKEPHWRHAWAGPLVQWLKETTRQDVTVSAKPVKITKLSVADARRLRPLTQGYSVASYSAKGLILPPESFLWEGGIWRAGLPLEQAFLTDKSHALSKGQFWIPSHPTTADHLAWLYSFDRPWNPYHHNPALAKRAAIISIVDLLGAAENHYYYHDKRSSYAGRRWSIHNGQMGFTLTFNAYCLLKVRAVLPAPVRKAWEDALQYMCEETAKTRPTGPQNMRLSFPTALYYAYLATGRKTFLKMYSVWEKKVVYGPSLSPAGVYYDGNGRAPDASYNGIAAHRLAELYSISKDPKLLDLLRKFYRLKNYMTLIEPDGRALSPSHFNDRCASSFANDQYGGREVQIAADVPEAAPSLRRYWPEKIDPAAMARRIEQAFARPSNRVMDPFPWGGAKGQRVHMHNWQPVLQLPYVEYCQDPEKLTEVATRGRDYPIRTKPRYTENFGDEFYVIKRPAYHVILYAGPANPFDNGKTNYNNMLKDEGGYFNGFGGGGISSFWTGEAGTLLIGRMVAMESYQRKDVKLEWGTYHLPGWMDWANNHIIGQTQEGKILCSARTRRPRSALKQSSSGPDRLVIDGEMVGKLPKQGVITAARVAYRRKYAFHDDRVEVDLAVRSDRPLRMASLYETLPVHQAENMKVQFLDSEDKPLAPEGETVENVSAMMLTRGRGGARIVFRRPVAIALISREIVSRQAGPAVKVRSYHVELANTLKPGRDSNLSYELVPFAGGETAP